MALIQIGAQEGIQTQDIENRAFSYEYLDFHINQLNMRCRVERGDSDVGKIIGLSIETDNTIDEVFNKINFFSLEIGGSKIIKIPSGILRLISVTERIGNVWLLKLNLEPFISSDLPLVALTFHIVYVVLEFNNINQINNSKLLMEFKYLDFQSRRNLLQEPLGIPIQQINGSVQEFNERNNVYMRLNFNQLSKGYFIKGDIDHLDRLTLKLNNIERYSYDRVMLNYVGKRVAQDVIFIPFNQNIDWKQRTNETYIGGLNQSRVENIQLRAEFSRPVSSIGVYSLTLNGFRIVHGLSNLRFENRGDIQLIENFVPFNPPPPAQTPVIIWQIQNKPINPDKKFCAIAHDEIEDNAEYCECHNCHNCYTAENLKEMFKTLEKKCPLCRENWINWIIYKNLAAE